jgi:hypothetical protein
MNAQRTARTSNLPLGLSICRRGAEAG